MGIYSFHAQVSCPLSPNIIQFLCVPFSPITYSIGDPARRLISLCREIPLESFPNLFSYHPSTLFHGGFRPVIQNRFRRKRSLAATELQLPKRRSSALGSQAAAGKLLLGFVFPPRTHAVSCGFCFLCAECVHHLIISHLSLHTGIFPLRC